MIIIGEQIHKYVPGTSIGLDLQGKDSLLLILLWIKT